MDRRITGAVALAAAAAGLCMTAPAPARGENLGQAWAIALAVNPGLQSRQAQSVAAGLDLSAARSARLPTVRTLALDAFLTASPNFKTNFKLPASAASGGGTGAGTATGTGGSALGFAFPSTFSLLGPGQSNLPVSLTTATLPLYTGGRLLNTIDAANARVNAERAAEFTSALDLKMAVAEAYVGVLRARKGLSTAQSNVDRLDSFAKDVRNRRAQGVALKADELAAEVSLANARLSLIQARTTLEAAWARYNRYLCRPLTQPVEIDELTVLPARGEPADLAAMAVRAGEALAAGHEAEVAGLTARALAARPELAGLASEARALASQAEATRGGVRPQAGFTMAYAYIGAENLVPQGIGAATFTVDWTITDGGSTRRRAAAIAQRERAALRRRDDAAADVALEVRTRWLDLLQARQRVPVARLAVEQAEESLNVVTDRYRQQLSNYTEVLDAETRRVTALTSLDNAVYDENLALFRLRRAVGDL